MVVGNMLQRKVTEGGSLGLNVNKRIWGTTGEQLILIGKLGPVAAMCRVSQRRYFGPPD